MSIDVSWHFSLLVGQCSAEPGFTFQSRCGRSAPRFRKKATFISGLCQINKNVSIKTLLPKSCAELPEGDFWDWVARFAALKDNIVFSMDSRNPFLPVFKARKY
jgi:hypothetical protein